MNPDQQTPNAGVTSGLPAQESKQEGRRDSLESRVYNQTIRPTTANSDADTDVLRPDTCSASCALYVQLILRDFSTMIIFEFLCHPSVINE